MIGNISNSQGSTEPTIDQLINYCVNDLSNPVDVEIWWLGNFINECYITSDQFIKIQSWLMTKTSTTAREELFHYEVQPLQKYKRENFLLALYLISSDYLYVFDANYIRYGKDSL